MPPLYTILAFVTVFSLAFGLPFTAIINRKSSPIGRALAKRIEGRNRRVVAEAPQTGSQTEQNNRLQVQLEQQQDLLHAQQVDIKQLQDRIDFLDRLLDKYNSTGTSRTPGTRTEIP
jgi:hypothetical protein